MKFFNIGDASADGRVEIIDEDKLCYQVKNISKGAIGIRTISKKLLNEFVSYFAANPDATADEARNALVGQSEIDKFEYGYASTLAVMAKMLLKERRKRKFRKSTQPIQRIPFPTNFLWCSRNR